MHTAKAYQIVQKTLGEGSPVEPPKDPEVWVELAIQTNKNSTWQTLTRQELRNVALVLWYGENSLADNNDLLKNFLKACEAQSKKRLVNCVARSYLYNYSEKNLSCHTVGEWLAKASLNWEWNWKSRQKNLMIFGSDEAPDNIAEAIMRAAVNIVLSRVPTEIRNDTPEADLYAHLPTYTRTIREQIRQDNGYSSIYVTSFARGQDSYEDEQGILTLWRCYTNTRGYCLQYNRDKIRSLLAPERTFYSYAALDLVDVVYGIDENDQEFIYLAQQYALWLLTELARLRQDTRFLYGMPRQDPRLAVTARLLKFCCSHKSPAYRDEREVRIYAIPVNQTIVQPFRPTLPKTIETAPTGRQYIVFGENRTPPLRPDRIIIGPNADLDETSVAAMFPNTIHHFCPAIFKSTISIRPDT